MYGTNNKNHKSRVTFPFIYEIELPTIKCTTLKRNQFLNHFLLYIEIAQQVYLFTQKYKLWPFSIKHDHNLCFGVNAYTCAISMKNKKLFKNWSRFRVTFNDQEVYT